MEKYKLKMIFLCVSLLLVTGIFMACEKETEQKDRIETKNTEVKKTAEKDKKENTEVKKTGTAQGEEYYAKIKDLSGNFTRIVGMCERDGNIYLLADASEYDVQSGQVTESYRLIEVSLEGDETGTAELALSQGEQVFKIGIDEENRFQILTLVSSKNKKGKQKEHIYVKYLETDGSITDGHELQAEKGQNFALGGNNALLAKDGRIYLADDMSGTVLSYDKAGKEQDACDLRGYTSGLVQTGNGSIYAYGALGQDQKSAFRELDQETNVFGEAVDTDGYEILNASVQAGEGEEVWLWSSESLYRADAETGEVQKVISWVNSGVNGQFVEAFLSLKDGSLAALVSDNGVYQLVFFRKGTGDETEKKVLTFACVNPAMKEKILDFNRTNQEYRMEVIDYSGYENAAQQLNLDILSGNVPDILDLSMLPVSLYVSKGLLTDLYALMENDEEVRKEDFLEPILKALEKDGKLPYLPAGSFSVKAMAGGDQTTGGLEGWSFEEFKELYEKRSEKAVFLQDSYFLNRDYFWIIYFGKMLDEFIQWDTGEVTLDSDYFMDILEFTKDFPSMDEFAFTDLDYKKAAKKGNFALIEFTLSRICDIRLCEELFKHAGGYHIISYPSEDKNNGLSATFSDSLLAITEQCQDKEGAWKFLRTFYTYDYQREASLKPYNGLMIRKDVFEKQMEDAMITESYVDEDGREINPLDTNTLYKTYSIPVTPLSEEEVDKVRAMIDRIDSVNDEGNDMSIKIVDVIMEEAEAFYAGDKTAEETAEIIQSRVKLIVSENS